MKIYSAPSNDLKAMTLPERCANYGLAITAIVAEAKRKIAPKRIYLFGSRARGNSRQLSDIDLAFIFDNHANWSDFSSWVHEEAPTLLDVDLIDLDLCHESLREQIYHEGIIIYEREY
ncbi:MAG: nucleotidyltransferase domain-containing protein [Deltaproteobacteria bacterium]|nr:nucleotidyltransferase domain-containing protein [Deltaproteobacteria bacterium]